MNRITTIVGAGAPLGFSLTKNITKPTTSNITNEVIRPTNHYDGTQINIVKEIYDLLEKTYPCSNEDAYNWKLKTEPKPKINFEMLFHVMEMYLSYEKGWSRTCCNQDIFPVFAPFTSPTKQFNVEHLRYIMPIYIIRIMDIVNAYNNYFIKSNTTLERWYKDFFTSSNHKFDIFNLNYDTTIENSMVDFEDGFEDIPGTQVQKFNTKKLWENKSNLSTINHLHGCINYYFNDDPIFDVYKYDSFDLFKYENYQEVKNRMMGRTSSYPTNQEHSEYYPSPIITGLRKTDKILHVPFDFYHGNLYNKIKDNNSLLIIGYSFGDIYVNNLIERMDELHGDKKRIVLIDYWPSDDIKEQGFDHCFSHGIPSNENRFMLKSSNVSYGGELAKELNFKDAKCPMYSKNRNFMLNIGGFKEASNHKDEIMDFLNS